MALAYALATGCPKKFGPRDVFTSRSSAHRPLPDLRDPSTLARDSPCPELSIFLSFEVIVFVDWISNLAVIRCLSLARTFKLCTINSVAIVLKCAKDRRAPAEYYNLFRDAARALVWILEQRISSTAWIVDWCVTVIGVGARLPRKFLWFAWLYSESPQHDNIMCAKMSVLQGRHSSVCAKMSVLQGRTISLLQCDSNWSTAREYQSIIERIIEIYMKTIKPADIRLDKRQIC